MTSFRLDPTPALSPRPIGPAPEHRPVESGSLTGRLLARQLTRHLREVAVEVRLPDGTRKTTGAGPLVATLTFKDFRILPRLLVNPTLAFAEAYESGRIEVAGDLAAFLERVYRQRRRARPPGEWNDASARDGRIGLRAARRNIHHHYDLGNEFYRLWLDPEMQYTCAYYPSPDDDLDTAQVAKMDLVCRKLRLKPGERVVEAGCGWGALALHMAKHYGVAVKAFNISAEQVRYARDRARQEAVGDRVEYLEQDYREIRGPFDVFVSVGMLEHVGLANYSTLGRIIHEGLEPGGRGLIHFIGRTRPAPVDAWIRSRIFPGAYAPALSEMIREVLERWEFAVLDVEDLRLHYARTLRHWLERFEQSAGRVAAMFDERFVRAWRLYLAGSQAGFAAGSMQLFQVVFARAGDNGIAWRRDGHPLPGLGMQGA